MITGAMIAVWVRSVTESVVSGTETAIMSEGGQSAMVIFAVGVLFSRRIAVLGCGWTANQSRTAPSERS